MSKFTMFFWPAFFIGTAGFAVYASKTGIGLSKPAKQPLSIREASVKGTGVHRTRYFMGGGIHSGK